MNAEERQAAFREWALTAPRIGGGEPYAVSNIDRNIMPCLRNAGTKYGRLIKEEVSNSLFETDDIDLVIRLYEAVKNAPGLDADNSTGLWLYSEFLKTSNGDKVADLVKEYSEVFEDFREGEEYKWQAVKCFQDNWNPDALDFHAMLKAALAKSGNLLAGGNYYAKRMILRFAEIDPEKTRRAFTEVLFDESRDLVERMKEFEEITGEILDEINKQVISQGNKPKKGDQDPRAISVYLSFRYPEAHYLYKYGMYCSVAKRLGKKTEKDKFDCVIGYRRICAEILESIKKESPDLFAKSDSSLSEDLQAIDPKHHLLVQDITYYADYYAKDYGWLPILDEYDPGLTVENWKELLADPSITSEDTLIALNCLKVFEAGATCIEIAEKYGRTWNFYNRNITSFGQRICDRTGCPLYLDEGKEAYWPVVCFGKKAEKGQKGTWAWKLRDEIIEALEEVDFSISSQYAKHDTEGGASIPNQGNNIILYGPPGTGKTFNTVSYAVAICEYKSIEEVVAEGKDREGRQRVKERFDEYVKAGRIDFVTFHQSYGYEEFVEGIRPILDDDAGEIGYTIQNGIFKKICTNSSNFEEAWGNFYQYVEENGPVEIKTLNGKPFKIATTRTGFKRVKEDSSEHAFFNYDQCLNVYQGLPGVPKGGFDNYRKAIVNHLKDEYGLGEDSQGSETRVLIIDEINRGNVSKIFGELITLIEVSKREGGEDEMAATLPYSGESFVVPSNLYIIGTMNTADRSIALMDTALRRRFDFIEMMPKSELASNFVIGCGVKVCDVMKVMNERIEALYDREHTIGHSYFMDINSPEELSDAFRKRIIPLLQEYFYDDYERIRLVLADNAVKDENMQFVTKSEPSKDLFFGEYDVDLTPDYVYAINDENGGAFDNRLSYVKIVNPKAAAEASEVANQESADEQ